MNVERGPMNEKPPVLVHLSSFVVSAEILGVCSGFALIAASTFSAVAGSDVMRTPTAMWIALRIAAAV
ncbi:MAG: hypothetical protein HY527_04045, partial [Betaproteobacteria bacterium]|nr:hypothetical protein [Betaproteobacteria bacterium]